MLALMISALVAANHPQALDAMLKLKENAQELTYIGWGVPYVGGQVLTAKHNTDGDVSWLDDWGTGHRLELKWQDSKKDIAILQASKPFPYTISIAKDLPEVGDRVFYRIYLSGGLKNATWTHGTVLGMDSDGDLMVAGWYHPGASGGGLLNESGELVGIVYGGVNWSTMRPRDIPFDRQSINDAIGNLFSRLAFPPAMACVPVTKWPK